MSDQSWTFSYEGPLHETFPALHEAQSAWLAQIEQATGAKAEAVPLTLEDIFLAVHA